MYVERIKLQREKDADWEVGYYIGLFYNAEESTFLDKNYKPITGDIWDYRSDLENRIIFAVNEKEE